MCHLGNSGNTGFFVLRLFVSPASIPIFEGDYCDFVDANWMLLIKWHVYAYRPYYKVLANGVGGH